MLKIPISGGPHTGKTTLLEALKLDYPAAHFVPEPATNVISRELLREKNERDYVARVPWVDYRQFGPLVRNESIRLERQIPKLAQVVFLDRSLIDTVGYARLNDFSEFVPDVQQCAREAEYSFALFCEPVEGYATNDVRRETADEARTTHDYLARAYDESGIEVVHLPAVSVEERVALVRVAVSAALSATVAST